VELIDNELNYGYLILISKNKVIEIPGAKAYPIYIVTQQTISKDGLESTKH